MKIKKFKTKYIKVFLLVSFAFFILWDQTNNLPENIRELRKEAIRENGNRKLPPYKFYTDGCTLWPDSLLNYSWKNYCIEHDIKYWSGGTEGERLLADEKLRDEVNGVLPGMGEIIYFGVRLGGRSILPLIPWPWGWGYGWNNK